MRNNDSRAHSSGCLATVNFLPTFPRSDHGGLPRIFVTIELDVLIMFYQLIRSYVTKIAAFSFPFFFFFFLVNKYFTRNIFTLPLKFQLTTCAGSWLRTITSDRTVYDKSLNSSVRYRWIEMINKQQIYYLLCLLYLKYTWNLNIFKYILT